MDTNDGWESIVTGYELSYKSRWDSPWFIVREFMQNALDEHDVAGIIDLPTIAKENGNVIIRDQGRGIGAEALLLRETKNAQGLRGAFGEGLKWACICALRMGYEIKITSPRVEIIPSVKKTSLGLAKDVDLVVFNWRNREAQGQGTEVEITGLKHLYKGNVFCHIPLPARKSFKTSVTFQGRVRWDSVSLLNKHTNQLFVRDIYARQIGPDTKESRFCYNIWDLDLDPDRMQLQNPYALGTKITDIWERCDNVGLIMQLLEAFDKEEYEEGISSWSCSFMRHPEKWKEAWIKVFGDKSVLHTNEKQTAQCKHNGLKVIKTSSSIRAYLEKAVPTDTTAMKDLDEEVEERTQKIDDGTLHPAELHYLETLRWLVPQIYDRLGESRKIPDIWAATLEHPFDGARLKGLSRDGEVLLPRDILADWIEALDSFIHEIAHQLTPHAPDRSLDHAQAINRIWKAVWIIRHEDPSASQWEGLVRQRYTVT